MASPFLLNRRQFTEGAAALGLIAALPTAAFAQAAPSVDQLMAPAALPDVWIGAADAPITVIEYASMTCPHCAAFHHDTYPALKSQYIDTGKVRFSLREFPFDPLAIAGFMVGRCAGPDKRNAMLELLFAQQKNWAYSDKPLQGLSSLVKQTGMSQDTFEACLKDQQLYNNVVSVQDTAAKKFGVNATPTFFINGKKAEGEMSIEEMAKLFQPYLKS